MREVNNKWPGRLPVGYTPINWDMTPEVGREDIDLVWNGIARKHNWWLSVAPHFDNVRAIATHRVRFPEDEIFYITARKPTAGMPVMHQCQTWLNSCGIGGLGTSVIVDETYDKASIFNALAIDANVDDKLEAVIEHVAKSKGSFLHDRPWNRDERPSNIPVVQSLAEFFKIVRRGKYAAS